MKPRERVAAALARHQPDRCPMQVSFTPEFADRLRADLRARGRLASPESSAADAIHNPHGGGNTYDLERAIGEDMLLTSVGWANSYYQPGDTYTDEWGITWKSIPYATPFGIGHYTEMIGHPLAVPSALDQYMPPDPNRPQLYEDAAWTLRQFRHEYWIVGVTVTTIFETAWALRGYDRLLMDFVQDSALADAILDIPYHYHLAAAQPAGGDGRGYDLARRRRGDARRHVDLAPSLATLP